MSTGPLCPHEQLPALNDSPGRKQARAIQKGLTGGQRGGSIWY